MPLRLQAFLDANIPKNKKNTKSEKILKLTKTGTAYYSLTNL